MSIVYLDTETTGLDPNVHEVWEIAWAWGQNEIASAVIAHSGVSSDRDALRINGYLDREGWIYDSHDASNAEQELLDALDGNTLCCANPAFDAAFLKARWGKAPWKYRLLDVEAYAMGALGYAIPQGLKTVADDLRKLGHDIPEPDHTAAADVATLRACHLALQWIYGGFIDQEATS